MNERVARRMPQVGRCNQDDRCYDFLNIFAEKFCVFFAKNKAKFSKNWILTLVFEKNASFFAEKWQKSLKIVILTSTPGRPDWANFRPLGGCLLWP
jgi:hypothetical protein